MFEDAVGWWQQWEGVYLGFWKWFAFFSRTTCQINLDECCKCSEILLEMNSTVVTLDCFSLYGNLMHIASAVYFHFSDALNAKKKKKRSKKQYTAFSWLLWKYELELLCFEMKSGARMSQKHRPPLYATQQWRAVVLARGVTRRNA